LKNAEVIFRDPIPYQALDLWKVPQVFLVQPENDQPFAFKTLS
jgi:hypothetical protein